MRGFHSIRIDGRGIGFIDDQLIFDGYIGNDISESLNAYVYADSLKRYFFDVDKFGYTGPIGKYPRLAVEVHDIADFI